MLHTVTYPENSQSIFLYIIPIVTSSPTKMVATETNLVPLDLPIKKIVSTNYYIIFAPRMCFLNFKQRFECKRAYANRKNG